MPKIDDPLEFYRRNFLRFRQLLAGADAVLKPRETRQ